MPKTLFLRAFIETSNGGYYSPIHANRGYTLLYIPENHQLRDHPSHLYPENIRDECTGLTLDHYYPVEDRGRPIHRDPRLDLGFYTGYYMGPPGYGRLPKKPSKRLGPGDLLLFMAGLAKYPEKLWASRFTRGLIRRIHRETCSRGLCGVYIVGGIIIEEVIDISVTGWDQALKIYPQLYYSPHYYRSGSDHPVAVVGKGFKLGKPLLIGYGKNKPHKNLVELIGYRDAYMVSRNNYRRSSVLSMGSVEEYIEKIHVLAEK